MGKEAFEVLATYADAFENGERIQLRNELLAVHTYDGALLDEATAAALKILEKRLEVTFYRDRLRQHVGSFRPARVREGDEQIDDALAAEGLAGDLPILREIDWLLSREAVRSHVFAYALGHKDQHARLAGVLREHARLAGDEWRPKVILARYLGGIHEAGRASEADALLRELSRVPDDAESLALAIVEIGANEERLGWIESALREGRLRAACLAELGRRPGWLSKLANDQFVGFVKALLLAPALTAGASAALELLVSAAEKSAIDIDALKPLVLEAMARLGGESLHVHVHYEWEQAGKFLIDHGDAAKVAMMAVRGLARHSASNEHLWNTLHSAAAREPMAAWNAVASVLAQPSPEAGHLQLAFMFHRSSFAWPSEAVLAWVGHDERRGRTVVSLVPRGASELDPILRALVQRFGPHSSVAHEIIARMQSTNGLVPSLADHDARNLAQARKWLTDGDADVRAFAQRLIKSLEESHAYHSAEEEDERRRWGT